MAAGGNIPEPKYTSFTYAEKRTVAGWLGFAMADYSLLYRASRDRFIYTAFHQKCDEKGPTVTVMYGSNGYVFGGYTSKNWTNTNTWIADDDAFLFSLRSTAGDQRIKQIGTGSHGIYSGQFGPSFGNIQGYYSIQPTNQANELMLGADGVFPASGITAELSYGFTSGALTNATLSGGATQLYDVEVYQVKESRLLPPDDAWRKLGRNFEWNPEQLKAEITKFKIPEELGVPHTKIIMFGPVGSGKSSFFNTLNSVYRGHVTGQAPTGIAKHSITTKLRNYKIRTTSGESLGFRICDTMGLEDDGGLMLHDIPYILDGNVDDHFQFNPAAGITPTQQDFNSAPKLKDRVHVAGIVLNAAQLPNIRSESKDKLRCLVQMLRHRGIPHVVMVTHIDQVCAEVANDNSLVFRSTSILDLVSNTAEVIGINRSNVMPIHNYENAISTDDSKDVLALLTLRQMLRFADDFFNEQLDVLGK